MAKIKRIITKLLPALVIVGLVFLAFHQTLRMYFWQDDYAFVFRLQHLFEPAGQLGQGYFGSGPYRFIYTLAIPFYPLFKLEPAWYMLLGIIVRLLSSLGVYRLARSATQSQQLAFAATAIYGVSFVGAETMLRIINTYQTHIGILLAALSVSFLVDFFKERRWYQYLAAVALFFMALEVAFVRSHGLLIVVAALALLEAIRRKTWARTLALLVPFVAIFYKIYIIEGTASPEFLEYLNKLASLEGAKNLVRALALVGNTIVPDTITAALPSKIKFLDEFSLPSLVFGLLGLLAPIWLAMKLWHKRRETAIGLVVGLTWLIANFLVYHLRAPGILFESTHRYFSYSVVGLAIIVVVIANHYLRDWKIFWVVIGAIVAVNIGLNINYQYRFVERLSLPARTFYRDLRIQLPHIAKGSAIYFDVNKDPQLGFQFRNFFHVASMPEATAIAVHYGIDRYDFTLVDSFDELLGLIERGETTLDKINTFYYDGKLTNTTDQVKTALKLGGPAKVIGENLRYKTEISISERGSFGTNHGLVIEPVKGASSSPIALTIEARINLALADPYPFYDITATKLTPAQLGPDEIAAFINSLPEKTDWPAAFAYLTSQADYRATASLTAGTSWKSNIAVNLTDNDLETFWMGDRGSWAEKHTESVVIDLKTLKTINRLLFVNAHPTRTPLRYEIAVSQDGKQYQTVKTSSLASELKAEAVQVDQFLKTDARFVKLTVTKTVGDDSPAISEIAVIEDRFGSLDLVKAKNLFSMPFFGVDESDLGRVGDFINGAGLVEVTTKTNQTNRFNEDSRKLLKPIFDGQVHRYSVILEPSGTKLEAIKLKPLNFPAIIDINRVSIRPLRLDELP